MDKPEKLVLIGEPYFSMGRNTVLVGMGIVALGFAFALSQPEVTMSDLVLPLGAMSLLLLGWLMLMYFIGWMHKFSDKRNIARLFQEPIWEVWHFPEHEWRAIVEKEYQSMKPEPGMAPYIGMVYSTIAGVILAVILFLVGKFAIKDQSVVPYINTVAVLLVLLMAGIGLFQPMQEALKAKSYKRDALRFPAPRIWFGERGAYHEALGFTSFKELVKVADRTKSRQQIEFVIHVTEVIGGSEGASASEHDLPVRFDVPAGCESRAGALVRRYRNEALAG